MLKTKFYKMLSWVLVLTVIITGIKITPITGISASALQAVYFEDNFSDGNYTDNPLWTVASGTWKVSADPKDSANNTLNQTDTGEGIITAGDVWTDYTVTMRFYTGAGQGYPGILARVQDSKNFYYFQMQKTSTLVLSKRVNGTDTTIKSAGFTMSNNNWYTLKMAFVGDTIKCYIVKDGTDTLLMEAADTTFSSGKIGIRNKWQSVYLDDIEVTEPPAANTAVLRTDSQTSSSISLSWDAIEGAAGYNIYRSATSGSGYTYLGNTTANNFIDTELTSDTTYYYKMAYLYGGATESQSTAEFAVTTAASVPAAPTGVSAAALNSTQIKLSWSEVTKADAYKVYRVVSGSAVTLYEGTDLTYTDTGLSPATAYSYNITAYNAAGESEPASVGETTYHYDAPSNFTASEITDTSVLLSWDPLTAANNTATEAAVSVAVISETGKSETVLSETALSDSVSSYSIFSDSTLSDSTLSGSTISDSALSDSMESDSFISAAALPESAATGSAITYTIKRSIGSSGTYTQIYNGQDTSFTDRGLSQGTGYFYKISATVSEVISAESDPLSVSTVRTAFTPDKLWVDTNGNAIDAHGAGIMYDDITGKYYWYGEYHKGTWPGSGVKVYSSSDLYNWTDEGMALTMIPSMDSFTEDPYISQIYAGRTDLEDIYESMRVGRIVERPKVIYNDSTGKYVMWMHMEGYTNADGTQNTSYGKAQAGVAVSDSPTGPFEYINDYRMDICPADQTDYFPSSKGMARDMNLFKDEDGTAYIIYSSEENLTIYISKLTEDYLDITGWHKENKEYDENGVPIRDTTYQAVYGEDYTRVFPGAQREAPAMFKYNGKYYLLTSGATGWSANENKYTVADDIFGTWQTLANPFVRTSSSDPNPSKAFNSQTTCVIPVDAENGKFIYMGDDWNGGNFANDSAKYILLPIDFGRGTDMTVKWYDSWTLSALDNASGISVKTQLPETYMTGATLTLPDQLEITTNGEDISTPVIWTYNSADLNEKITFKNPGLYTLQAVLTELNNKTVTYKIYSVPDKTLFFVNCSGYKTEDYSLMSSYMQDTLYNSDVIDQGYDDTQQIPWGYAGSNTAISGSSSGDIFSTLRYLNAGNSSSSSAGKDLTYKFTAANGTYTVYTGFNDIWSNSGRTADLYINGTKKGAITFISNMIYKNDVEVTNGTIEITVRNTASQDPLINWIMITNDALSHKTDGGLKISEESTLSWNKVIGAMAYTLYRSESRDGIYVPVYTGNDSAFTDSILKDGRSYYYKVSSRVDGTESALSDSFEVIGNVIVKAPVISTDPDNTVGLPNNEVVEVTLNTATEGAAIYYTTDNTEPNVDSSVYSGVFEIKTDLTDGETVTVKAVAVLGDSVSQTAAKIITFLPANSEVTPSPTPTMTPEPTITPEPTVTTVPTITIEPTVTPEPTVTLLPTATPTPTSKPRHSSNSVTPTPITENIPGSKNTAPVTVISRISNDRLQVNVNVSEVDVITMLDNISEKNPDPVQITLTTQKVLKQIEAGNPAGTDITVNLSKNVLSNKNIQNLDIHLDAALLKAVKISGNALTITVKEVAGKELYRWSFNHADLVDSEKEMKDINLTLTTSKAADAADIRKLLGDGSESSQNITHGIAINFNHEEILPVKSSVRIYIGNLFTDLSTVNEFYFYYYNPSEGTLEALPNGSGYKVDRDGYITISIVHCSDYVLLPTLPSNNIVTSLSSQISITPSTKTLYVQGKTGKTTNIKLTLPSTLELVSSLKDNTSNNPGINNAVGTVMVNYQSLNRKIAVVDKYGKITAKSVGNTKIITTVTLFNGEIINFTTNITVKKPYIKFSDNTGSMELGDNFTFTAGNATAKSRGINYITAKIGTIYKKIKL